MVPRECPISAATMTPVNPRSFATLAKLCRNGANFFRVDFDAPSERAQVIATIAAVLGAHSLASLPGEKIPPVYTSA